MARSQPYSLLPYLIVKVNVTLLTDMASTNLSTDSAQVSLTIRAEILNEVRRGQ